MRYIIIRYRKEKMMKEDIEKLSPLTEATYYILLSLHEPKHGYGIIKDVESFSQKRVVLAAGTLYGALNNLVKHKLIVPCGVDPENSRRKIYQITPLGLELLEYEIKRYEELASNGRRFIDD